MNGAGLNRLMLIGRVGRDPEMRYTAHGVPVTTFSVATKRSWVDADGEQVEATDWFNVVSWRHLAERCYECLAKGARVYLEGRVQTRWWEDDEGEPRYQVEVVASDLIVLDSPSDGASDDDWPFAEGGHEAEDEEAGEPAAEDSREARDSAEEGSEAEEPEESTDGTDPSGELPEG